MKGSQTTTTKPGGQIVPANEVMRDIEATYLRVKPQLRMVLPKSIDLERFGRIMMTTIGKSRALRACKPASLWGSLMTAAQLGLEIDNGLGHAYLIPYKDECVLVVGYKGYVDLARRSGQVSTVEARVVYEGDLFDYEFGLTPFIKHKPCGESEQAKITHAYAVLGLRDGGKQFDVMTRKEIDAIRSRSRAGSSGPWVTDFAEMSKKTALRRLLKLAPMSVEAQKAIALDELADANVAQGLDAEWDAIDTGKVIDVKAEPIADEPGAGDSGNPDATA